MKTCPVCKRDYAKHMRYCTRDGTKLDAENLQKTCPECSLTFPENIDKCPEHNLELVTKIESIKFSNKLSNKSSSKENISPVVASILEEIVNTGNLSTQRATENKLEENLPYESIETNQVTQQGVIKAAETKNLTAPAVLPFDTLGQYAVDQVSADRKLLVALALIVVCSVAGFAAYSFPYAVEWPKVPRVSADSQAKDNDVLETLPNSEIALERNNSVKEDIIQQIEYPKAKTDSLKLLSRENKENKQDSKLRVENKIAQELKNKPLAEASKNKVSSKEKLTEKLTKKESKSFSTKEAKMPSKAINKNEVAKVDSKIDSKKSIPSIVNSKEKPGKESNNPATLPANEPNVARSKGWERPTLEQAPKLEAAKVIAKVVNKSRLQTPNGYVYQFDLVVKEINGIRVKWNYTTARKTSYSGSSSVVSGLLGDELDANASLHFRMAVRMTGRCIEDWYGQIIYNCSGVDENGNKIQLNQVLALDNDFPTY
ncbi:MAG: hypothetical protein HY819_20105 [Acidobacteria bacterium]|nr:hypothetical protein [Acidobacteriota bacterium]